MKRPKAALIGSLMLLNLALVCRATQPDNLPGSPTTTTRDATNYLGAWIWDRETHDKQTCRFWKSFQIPVGSQVASAGTYVLVVTDPSGAKWPSPPSTLVVEAPQNPGFSGAVLSSGALSLTWTNGTTLQVSSSVLGSWTNIAGASSPYTITNLTLPQQFYRIEP